jgi:virulence-associated protein VagC
MDKEHDHGRYDSGHSNLTGANFFKNPHNKVKIHEENGSVILTPVVEEKLRFDHLIGIFSDGKMSSEEFMGEKAIEKELEL